MGNSRGGMKCRQNITQLVDMFGTDSAWIILLKKPFQSLVTNCHFMNM